MIFIKNHYDPLVDPLLDKLSAEDPKEVELAIEALRSLVDPYHLHKVDTSLEDRVKGIQTLIQKPPPEVLNDEIDNFKTYVLEKVSKKIQDLSSKYFIIIPSYTTDTKTNAKIHEALLKLRQYEHEQLEQERGALQLYTPLEGRDDFDSKDKFDAFTKAKAFLEGSQRCLLLMGDAGAGKSTFAYYLADTLWQAHEKGFAKEKPIPVLVPLITIGRSGEEPLARAFPQPRVKLGRDLVNKKASLFCLYLGRV